MTVEEWALVASVVNWIRAAATGAAFALFLAALVEQLR